MRPQFRPLDDRDAEAVIGLSLLAWAPVFASIEQALGSEIYGRLYPDGWRASQRQAVRAVCASQEKRVWVAEVGNPCRLRGGRTPPRKQFGRDPHAGRRPRPPGQRHRDRLDRVRARADQRRRDGDRDGRDGGRPRARRSAPHVREGRLPPPADSQILQESVATRGCHASAHASTWVRLPHRFVAHPTAYGSYGPLSLLAEAGAERIGRPPDDPTVRKMVGRGRRVLRAAPGVEGWIEQVQW